MHYGAESGLEAALNAIRGHVAPTGLPNGTKIGFRTAVDPNKSNRNSDHSSQARLSAWLDYSNGGESDRVSPAGANFSYSVVLSDPDDPNGTKRAADDTYVPKRLQVQSVGYGPRGSIKRMEMIVQKNSFDFEPNAMLMMRGSEDGSAAQMSFDIGDSAAKFYTGHDNATGDVGLPAFGVTNSSDLDVAGDAITKGATVEDVEKAQVAVGSLAAWLQDANAARAFLNDMQAVSRSMGRYYQTFTGMAGSEASPTFTFVNGNCTLDGGAGLLIVGGDLIMNGNPNFKGVILVLGGGTVNRNGGGNGNVYGTIYVAKFARSWPSSENALPHPFLAPTFNTSGVVLPTCVTIQSGYRKQRALGDIGDVREY